jgi:oligopeptide/dipeptide ABC transporter ATP-binding protein
MDAVVHAGPAPLLSVHDLRIGYDTDTGPVTVVHGVSFDVHPGEVVGLVGESGSGKTQTSLAIMRLVPSPPGRIEGGSVTFDGRDLLALSPEAMRDVRGNDIAMIFQDPMQSLNPAFTVGNQMVEALRLHTDLSRKQAPARAAELLDMVGIADPVARLKVYPHQLSGGMRQRVMIAMALCCSPRLLIADEPTTALDVTIQAQILELLKSLQRELGMAVIFVTHDLGVVADICDRVVVMYAGQVVEEGMVDAIFATPHHPYTEALLGAIPQLAGAGEMLASIPGVVPTPAEMPIGCRFGARCAYHQSVCDAPVPLLRADDVSAARCVRLAELQLRGVE